MNKAEYVQRQEALAQEIQIQSLIAETPEEWQRVSALQYQLDTMPLPEKEPEPFDHRFWGVLLFRHLIERDLALVTKWINWYNTEAHKCPTCRKLSYCATVPLMHAIGEWIEKHPLAQGV